MIASNPIYFINVNRSHNWELHRELYYKVGYTYYPDSNTDKKGHFKIQKNNNISSTLVFQKDLYHTDTISSIQIQNGERQKELFKGDIIYMLKKKDRDSIFKINNL